MDEKADPLTTIVHRDKAYNVGKGLVGKTQGADSSPAVQDSNSSLYRQPHHCLRKYQRYAQRCAC
jgi:Membrane GTPase LepA